MMRIARGLLANEAWLLPDEEQVGLAALAGRLLGMGEPRLVCRWLRWLQRGLGGILSSAAPRVDQRVSFDIGTSRDGRQCAESIRLI